jgi:hypothetical protein
LSKRSNKRYTSVAARGGTPLRWGSKGGLTERRARPRSISLSPRMPVTREVEESIIRDLEQAYVRRLTNLG